MPVKVMLALYIGGMGARAKNFYNDYAKRLGYEDVAVKIQDLYLAGKKAEAMAMVPDKLVDEVALVGQSRANRGPAQGVEGVAGQDDADRHRRYQRGPRAGGDLPVEDRGRLQGL